MNKKAMVIFISFFLFFLVISFYVHAGDANLSRFKGKLFENLMMPERVAIFQPARVIKTLKIKPEMSILDIGAGIGFFSFRFAEALKGTGKVFATEVNSPNIEYIKEKMRKFKYKNIFPVLVEHEGVDPFYKQHSFDIIFLCNVYYLLWHHEDYFKELRPSLKKKGRLYILQPKNDYDFNEIMFGDFKEVIKLLISKGENFPVFQRLGKETQYFIKNWQDNDVPPEIRSKIIRDFNKMVSDRFLFNALLDYAYTIEKEFSPWQALSDKMDPYHASIIKWLAVQLEENRVFDKKKKTLTAIDKKRLCMLNRILLTRIFQLWDLLDPPWAQEKNSIISTLKAAGYRFVCEYDFLPCHYFFEFKRKY